MSRARSARRARRGVALFAALGLVAIIGLLVGGAVASASVARRADWLGRTDAILVAEADFAIGALLSDRARDLAELALGEPLVSQSYGNSQVAVTTSATRLPGGVVWIVADARLAGVTGDGARRRFNLVARWPAPDSLPRAGVVARGDVRLGTNVQLTRDTTGDADCRVSSSAGPDVVVPAASRVTGIDSARVAHESSASDSSSYYLNAAWMALLDSTPGVVRVRGDTTIAGGTFDGLLFVGGVLRVTGAFVVNGLVVAGGAIEATNANLVVNGALLSFANPLIGQFAVDLTEGAIRFSPCAVARAVRRGLSLRPVHARSWAELF